MDFISAATHRIIAAALWPATSGNSRQTALRSDYPTGHPETMHDKNPDYIDTELRFIYTDSGERVMTLLQAQAYQAARNALNPASN